MSKIVRVDLIRSHSRHILLIISTICYIILIMYRPIFPVWPSIPVMTLTMYSPIQTEIGLSSQLHILPSAWAHMVVRLC